MELPWSGGSPRTRRWRAFQARWNPYAAGGGAEARLRRVSTVHMAKWLILVTSTALVGFIGDIRRFPTGRHFASYLGLTPREYSSGLKRNLGRISKRGDGYLRTLLIHGARSVLVHARKQQPDRLRVWANTLAKTHVHNKGRGPSTQRIKELTKGAA